MIVLIDNYDSFSYNLVQMIGSIEPDIKVVRNDQVTVDDIESMKPSHLILSPGPGYPRDAGILEEAVIKLKGKMPILGVCLGHMRGIRRNHCPCKEADARKAERYQAGQSYKGRKVRTSGKDGMRMPVI